ncbi:tyrosine-type recombinase/integrase [Curtobacterium flaccumfaciens pv. flaccumfaciens]|uniref:tyrosine-type recombinase/integrase n=1 Tax=Curtobacterium flaccumfaciens TaxID=2035 RepID=UPI001BDE28DF|nr:tyrosine-type recombinase/integrase [Curtobacterium flaccumfaciens]MBT1669639.1 tyrosine-type recombinase/integrase [Curtobacterium flaccumfaciens pv. flaccumfaciens]
MYLTDDRGSEVSLVNEYLAHLANRVRSPHTVRAYAYDLQYLFRFASNRKVLLTDLRPRHTIDFLAYLRNEGSAAARAVAAGAPPRVHNRRPIRLSDATVRRVLVTAKNFYEFLIVSELYDSENPFLAAPDSVRSLARRPALGRSSRQTPSRGRLQVRAPKRKPRPIPRPIVRQLLDRLRTDRNKAIVLLGLNGGLRPADILLLELSDISYGNRQISVKVKHDDARGLRTKSTEDRPLDFHDRETLSTISRYVMHERPRDSNSSYLFLVGGKGSRRNEPLSYWAVNKLFARNLDALELRTPDRTQHALRHTHATEMRRNGMRPQSLGRRLGHSTIAAVEMYSDTPDEFVAEDYAAAERRRQQGEPE